MIYAAEMNLLRIEAQRGNLARMREMLLQQLPINGEVDLREFEWNYWYRYLSQAQVLRKFDKAQTPGTVLAVLPGGQRVAWTEGKSTQLIDLRNGTSQSFPYPLRVLVERTRFSDTGRAIVGDCQSQAAFLPPSQGPTLETRCTVYEPTGKAIAVDYPADTFSHISFLNISPDGKRIVVLGNDVSHTPDQPAVRICVWNIDTNELVLNHIQRRQLNRVEFSPDGNLIAAHLCHGTKRYSNEDRDVVVLLDVATSKELGVLRYNDDIDAVWWMPDGSRLLLGTLGFSGSNRKQLLTWSADEPAPKLLSRENIPDYMKGSVSPDGRLLAVTGRSVPNIRLIDTTNGEIVDKFLHAGGSLDSVTFAEDGNRVVATTSTGEVLSWNLSRDRDLFALQSHPLTQMAHDGFALSRDQTLLAIALADGAVCVRTRDGRETLMKPGTPNSTRSISILKFSDDNRYLAHRTNVGPDGKALASGTALLNLFDLQAARRLWQIAVDASQGFASIRGVTSVVEFSPDNQKLIHVANASTIVLDCRTGRGQSLLAAGTKDKSSALGVARHPGTGQLFVAVGHMPAHGQFSVLLCNPITGETIYRCNLGGMIVAFPLASPDGEHVSLLRPGTGVEVWNLRTEKRIFASPGLLAAFSTTGSQIAILGGDGGKGRVIMDRCSVWDTVNGRKLCDLALKGNELQGLRFSPAENRLLTLHGLTLNGGSSAHGRLWDAKSGREILDIPLADINHYVWDLAFDASGQKLTKLLFGKSSGTGGGGESAIFDAQPLDEREDSELIADRLVATLSEQFPLVREMTAEVEARTRLKPAVRKATIAKVAAMQDDPHRLATFIGETIVQANATTEMNSRALVWAEELRRLEPKSLRSHVLLGAAQFRNGLVDDALQSLGVDGEPKTTGEVRSNPDDKTRTSASVSPSEKSYLQVRQALLALALARKGEVQRSQEIINGPKTLTSSSSQERSQMLIVLEALYRIPRRLTPAPVASLPSPSVLEQSFSRLDRTRDGEIDQSEALPGMWREVIAYDADQNSRLNRAEYMAATRDVARFGRAMSERSAFPVAQQLEFLDEVIREAPNYVSARNARAWLRATSSDAKLRNPNQAIEDATHVCKSTQWKESEFLDTLAAAYADKGDFASAINWQTKAIGLSGGPARRAVFEKHLVAYQQNLAWREPGSTQDEILARSGDLQTPLIAPDAVHQARRIPGFGAAWSPDSRKIIRNLKFGDPASGLEIIDLQSNETRLVCKDGADPIWSDQPAEKIYFVRGPEGKPRTGDNESIWQCDLSGDNLRKIADGGYPSLSTDRRLFVREVTRDGKIHLKVFSVNDTNPIPSEDPGVFLNAGYPSVSPNGKFVAFSSPDTKLRIRQIGANTDQHEVDISQLKVVYGGWSPDSRYFVYGSGYTTISGLWLLDVNSGERRLLADIAATNARWSPDGRFIAADERAKNQIVLLDVTQLHLEKGLDSP